MVNNVSGQRHPVADTSNQDNMELQQRNARPATTTAGVGASGEARQQEIDRITHLLENYFPGGEEIRDNLHQKATELHDEIGHTADDVKATIANGENLDRITSSLEGGAGALGYALSGVPGDLIGKGIAQNLGLHAGTPIHDFVTGMASGVTAVGLKAILEKLLADSLKDTKWLQADGEKLEPFMQAVMEKRDSALHKIGQAGLGGLGFDARNVVTGGLSAGTQTLKENDPRNPPVGILAGAKKPGYVANQSVGTILTVAAGSMSGVVQNNYNKLHGPEFLFGRTDWKERYQALSDTSVSGQIINGAKSRVTTAAKDAATPQKWGAGILSLLTTNQLAEMGALGAGLGGTNIAKSAAREGVMKAVTGNTPALPQDLLTNPAFRALREGAAQAANLPAAGIAYFMQGLAGVGATAANPHLQNVANRAMNATKGIYNTWRKPDANNVSGTRSTTTGSASSSNLSMITGQDVPLPSSHGSINDNRARSPSDVSSMITGQDVPLPSSHGSINDNRARSPSDVSSMITGQDVPLPSSHGSINDNRARSPSDVSSMITGQDVPLPSSHGSFNDNRARSPSDVSSMVTGQDVPLPSSHVSSNDNRSRSPSDVSSTVTGQDVPLPSSRASSMITGQDVPLPSSRESSIASGSRPASSRSNTPSTRSRSEMQAQQTADRIGKMPPPNKAV